MKTYNTRWRPKSRTPRTPEEIEQFLADPSNEITPEILEELADDLLAPILKDKSRTKSTRQEYTILSERQLQRRLEHEVFFTYLPRGAKAHLGIVIDDSAE